MTPNIRRYWAKVFRRNIWTLTWDELFGVSKQNNIWSPFSFSKRSQKKSKKRGSGLGPTIQSGSAAHASTLKEGLTFLKSQLNVISQFFKVWVFWGGHKIWKNLRRTFDKSIVFCARNSVLVKKSTKIFF